MTYKINNLSFSLILKSKMLFFEDYFLKFCCYFFVCNYLFSLELIVKGDRHVQKQRLCRHAWAFDRPGYRDDDLFYGYESHFWPRPYTGSIPG